MRKSRATTPSAKSDRSQSAPVVEIRNGGQAALSADIQRPTSKGSQTDLPPESAAVLNQIVEETFEKVARPQPEMPDNVVPAKDLESDRIRTTVESRPNSPGVDPRKAMPISAEDAAELDEPLVDGLGPHDSHHKAATVHLPPKEVQECHIRERERAREQKEDARHLSINLPPRDASRNAEPLSSPGSTVDAQSATTPALHDASTDTSPENDNSRYDAERLDKDADVQTPPELKPTPEEVAEKEHHDKILDAQIAVSRAEILRSSPSAALNQLRMEEQQAASLTGTTGDEQQPNENEGGEGHGDALTKEASEVVEDVIEDEDKVVAAPTPEDVLMSGVEASPEKPKDAESVPPEVADSEAEADTPVDAMDIDATTVKDSFESSEALESRIASSPAVAGPTEPAAKPSDDHEKSSSSTSAASTPRRTASTAAATPPLERSTTRLSSGAIRHKSVNEILGEIPRPNTSNSERTPAKLNTDSGSAENSSSPSRSATPQSPGIRSLVEKAAKERERSKLSHVTFSQTRANKSGSNDTALMPSGPQASKPTHDDYFKPLFIASAASDRRGIPTLDSLLATAHKTITTSNGYVPLQETQTVKVLKRIYQLQSQNKWTLRQPKRAPEPNRPTTQWDVLLQEAKWMRTDFREERKWKMTVASNLASACAEWVAANPEDRKLLQVNATSPPVAESSKDTEMGDSTVADPSQSTPDLVASGELDSPMEDFDEEPRLDLMETVAPTAIFALQDDDVVFGLRRSPTADKLLAELPMFGAPLSVPQSEIPTSEIDPDRAWRRPALPLSKYVEGRMELKSEGPPRKRSRFEYENDDDDEGEVVFGEQGKNPVLPPESTDVALFNPEHKHIRDRIHSSHQFRPPSEFPMPLQSFFETRIASQWTWDEDNELKTLVREYCYNWSLISSMLASKSNFSSGAERRTPWECFERWIYLEGLPADMQKTHYFRAYTTRIEAANRNVMAQAAAIQPGSVPNGQIQPPSKRRTTTSVRVERRRNQKHLTLVDAMRKLAKKRETSIQKQQQAAGMAALRKANENHNAPQRGPVHTPQDFSRIKHERDEQFKERVIALQQRQEAQRRVQNPV
jgi:chromatin modification-related protein VID21